MTNDWLRNVAVAVLCLLSGVGPALAQNSYEEVIRYDDAAGLIILPIEIDGATYPFALDMQSSAALRISASRAERIVNPVSKDAAAAVTGRATVNRVGLGEHIFHRTIQAETIESELLKTRDLAGTVGPAFFGGNILTIVAEEGTVTVSAPYKPSFIPLRNRAPITTGGTFAITVAGTEINVKADFLTEASTLILSQKDYDRVKGALKSGSQMAPEVVMARGRIENIPVASAPGTSVSTLGSGILSYGAVSFDFGKGHVYFVPYTELQRPDTMVTENTQPASPVTHLDVTAFRERVFDFRMNDKWEFKGLRPAVIDFWAEWCAPCKRLDPILASLAAEFAGKVDFYKVNIDDQKEIADHFAIKAIPLLWLIPAEGGEPIPIMGLRSAEQLRQAIGEALLEGNL